MSWLSVLPLASKGISVAGTIAPARPAPARPSAASGGSGERQPWDFGRFVKTVLYFNPPPPPGEVIKSLLEQPGKILRGLAAESVEVHGGPGRGCMHSEAGRATLQFFVYECEQFLMQSGGTKQNMMPCPAMQSCAGQGSRHGECA